MRLFADASFVPTEGPATVWGREVGSWSRGRWWAGVSFAFKPLFKGVKDECVAHIVKQEEPVHCKFAPVA